jgi:hypothetical protein
LVVLHHKSKLTDLIAHTKNYKKDKYAITPLKIKNCYLVSGSGVVGVGVGVTLRGGGGTIGG